jgi:hypothetical protein
MPVTSVGTTPFRGSDPAPAAAGASAPTVAAMPAAGAVGHGVTRLMERPAGAGVNAPFIPGTPPPKGETAGAHGAHRGRISIR